MKLWIITAFQEDHLKLKILKNAYIFWLSISTFKNLNLYILSGNDKQRLNKSIMAQTY